MNKRLILSFLFVLSLILLAACGGSSDSDSQSNDGSKENASDTDEKIVLKFADYFPNTHFMSIHGTQAWIEKVEELSEGQIEIDFYPGEQLGKGADTLDLVRTGLADIGNVSQGYVSGTMQLSSVVSLPGLMDSVPQSTKASFELISSSPVLEKDFLENGVRPLLSYTSTAYEFWTTEKKVETVEDLKGLKIRTSGGSANIHIEAVGATPTSISAPEQYEALERNVIDGTLFTINSIPSYNLQEVVNYATVGAGGGPNLGLVFINEEVWQSLPEHLQEVMLQATEIVLDEFSKAMQEEGDNIMNEFSGDIEFVEVDEEEFREASKSVIDDWVEENEGKGLPAQEALDKYKELLEKYK